MASTVLVPFVSIEKLRTRELEAEKEIRVGQLRVAIRPRPLTISVHRVNGQLVQDLTFEDGTNQAVVFRTEAPVFGLGEGAQQFDRRGALYPMEPSWGGWNRPVLGSVVPSPFLIGTEGWALFFHAPEGRLDLRENGRFVSKTNGTLDIFLIDVKRPSDALTEYIRLTGPRRCPNVENGFMVRASGKFNACFTPSRQSQALTGRLDVRDWTDGATDLLRSHERRR
jgi:hypothetical protein